ncbi:uncharacterized protein METZ01_LOCUS362703 [marine metagenome]|uniref:Uncharacterized protein n=1 Tax=marine metagenome TaxID=408172 RepID=A0A382SJ04_9ZZZZ
MKQGGGRPPKFKRFPLALKNCSAIIAPSPILTSRKRCGCIFFRRAKPDNEAIGPYKALDEVYLEASADHYIMIYWPLLSRYFLGHAYRKLIRMNHSE